MMSEKVLGWVCPNKLKLSRRIRVVYKGGDVECENSVSINKMINNGVIKEELYERELCEHHVEFLDCKDYISIYGANELKVCEDGDGNVYFEVMRNFDKKELDRLLKDINKKLGTKYKWQGGLK